MQSAFSVEYSLFVSQIVAEANVIAVSVEYRLFPKDCIPACYEDGWGAIQWVGLHCKGGGPECWINDYADLGRVFVGGDSAGGNITHNLVAKVTGYPIFRIMKIMIRIDQTRFSWISGLIGSDIRINQIRYMGY